VRVWVVAAGLLALAGCADQAAATPPAVPPTPRLTNWPAAAAAGGACRLLDYPIIEQVTGARFDVSAATVSKKTYTCVVQAQTASRPDLALSVTATTADASIFADEMVPKGAKRVKGLGKVAYQLTLAPGKGYGAGVEVGWLSGDGRLICLRYTFAAGHDKAAAGAFAPKLIALAKKIDKSSP
jgi:hypothetical protein